MSLWATMINITLKATASKVFLEDDFLLSRAQLVFIADSFFNGVKA